MESRLTIPFLELISVISGNKISDRISQNPTGIPFQIQKMKSGNLGPKSGNPGPKFGPQRAKFAVCEPKNLVLRGNNRKN